MDGYVAFDLELERSPEGEEGWDAARRGELGISVACLYDSELDLYRFYDRHNLSALVEDLELAPLVVGFNSIDFDMPCLSGVVGRTPMIKGHFDILQEIWTALSGRRKGYGLGPVCERTLGLSKIGNGTRAPELLAEGRIAELYSYCLHDVFLTRLLFEHIILEGFIIDPSGDKLCF